MNKLLSITILLSLFLIACNNSSKNKKGKNTDEELLKQKTTEQWSYSGESGPEFWAQLEKESDCGGQYQSPININTINSELITNDIKASDFHYENATDIQSVKNNGHTIKYNFTSNENIMIYDGGKYLLKQFHFHSPSEHTINGVRYPLELHMVHYDKDSGEYLVFAIMAQQGDPSETFEFLGQFLPLKQGETKTVNKSQQLSYALNESIVGALYNYRGSLTTPPCTEKVNWFVLEKPISVSEEQIKMLSISMPINNYRDIQPLNGRKINKIMPLATNSATN